jgi:hypothetical protein
MEHAMQYDPNPYAASSPTSGHLESSAPPPVLGSKVLRYNNNVLIQILTAMFVLGILAAIVAAISNYMQIQLLSNTPLSEQAIQWNDIRQTICAITSLIILLVTSIFFGTYVIRAHHNVRGFGAKGMTITPGWAFGYFFVPILTLFKPYVAMSELWRASQSPTQWTNNSTGLVPLWWTFWIVSNILGQISFRMSADTIPLLLSSTWVSIVSDLIDVPLCLVAMFMLIKINRAQVAWAESANQGVPASNII